MDSEGGAGEGSEGRGASSSPQRRHFQNRPRRRRDDWPSSKCVTSHLGWINARPPWAQLLLDFRKINFAQWINTFHHHQWLNGSFLETNRLYANRLRLMRISADSMVGDEEQKSQREQSCGSRRATYIARSSSTSACGVCLWLHAARPRTDTSRSAAVGCAS